MTRGAVANVVILFAVGVAGLIDMRMGGAWAVCAFVSGLAFGLRLAR